MNDNLFGGWGDRVKDIAPPSGWGNLTWILALALLIALLVAAVTLEL